MLSLRLYEPVLYSTTFLEDISLDAIATWRRSTRRMGGYWRGSFTLYGDKSRLAKFFYERLACHLVERYGGNVTWEGMIYEMDLTIGGTTRRRSLDLMANYINLALTDNNGENKYTAGVSTSTNSIKWFGRREELLTIDGANTAGIGTLEPEARCDTYLKEHAWPWARPVGALGIMDENQLVVNVCGYVFTSNWRYETVGDDSTDDVSTYISELIATDCEWIKAGRIASNTLQVIKGVTIPTRIFDVIVDNTELGDQSGNPWRFYVDNDQRANYQQINVTPEYYLRNGALYASAGGSGEAVPWTVKPGVVRDTNYPVSKWDYQGWLGDARDFYIEEVEAGPGGLMLKTELFEEGEILAAQAAYNNSLEATSPIGGGGGSKHIWELLGYSKEQKNAMSPEEWQAIKRAAQKRKRETGKFK
jgi:hypothetical protein